MPTPIFVHDCKNCRHLGSVVCRDAPTGWVDLYHCPNEISGPTVIARWSDEGREYTSCPVDMVERVSNPILKIAKSLLGE